MNSRLSFCEVVIRWRREYIAKARSLPLQAYANSHRYLRGVRKIALVFMVCLQLSSQLATSREKTPIIVRTSPYYNKLPILGYMMYEARYTICGLAGPVSTLRIVAHTIHRLGIHLSTFSLLPGEAVVA